jgi:hypothetical protein
MSEYYDEPKIRAVAGAGAIAMLDQWKALSQQHFGGEIPVIVASRYKCPIPLISSTLGEVNATSFIRMGGKMTLAVWLEKFEQPGYVFDDVLVSHEVGHRVIAANGFYSVGTAHPAWHQAGGLLYSLAQHSPLYKMQQELGIPFQTLADQRARGLINGYVKQVQSLGIGNAAVDAMVFADDILHASSNVGDQLLKVVLPKIPAVQRIAEKVVHHAKQHDLLDVADNLQFMESVINELAPGPTWYVSAGITAVQQEIAAVP